MLKTILIATICILPTLVLGQVYKFRAFQSYFDKSNSSIPIRETDWDNVDILVVINLDKQKIDTYGKKEMHLDLIKTYEPTKDSHNNDLLTYESVDDDGDKALLLITLFKGSDNYHIATIRIVYTLGTIHLRLRNNTGSQ